MKKVRQSHQKRTLMALATLAIATTTPAAAQTSASSSQMEAYYSIHRAPLWFAGGSPTTAASSLPPILRRAPLDGVPEGAQLAQQVQLAIETVRRDPGSTMQMDRVIASAWVRYVQAVQSPTAGVDYGEPTRRRETVIEILAHSAQKQPDQLRYVLKFASVNPLYETLRDVLWTDIQISKTAPSAAALRNLARLRVVTPGGKHLIVDSRAAQLYMFDDGQLVGSMRVIVGKPETPTPLIVSKIYSVTLNPYWNVPASLVKSLTAPRVLSQGASYLHEHNYAVVTEYGPGASEVSPGDIDWRAVADGKMQARVRQLPGPFNSMGKLKFAFPNSEDIYLHDTPEKILFDNENRLLSNGCIRVQDAQRLGRWLLGGEPHSDLQTADLAVTLPQPVPILVTYLTMHAQDGKLTLLTDPYGWDTGSVPPALGTGDELIADTSR